MKTSRRRLLTGSLATLGTLAIGTKPGAPLKEEAKTRLQITTFTADVTPPLGEPLDCGFSPPASVIEHPLFAKGVLLRDAAGTYVMCALDWEGLCNDAHDLFTRRIAEAAGTSPSRVAVQALHQHSAPTIDS